MKKQTAFIKNENGIALVMVLLILTVMTILGLALMGLTLNNMKMSSGERTYQSTYYIAESGITYTMDKVNKSIVNIYNDSTGKGTFFSKIDGMITNINNESAYRNFEETFGYIPEAKISIKKIGNYDNNANHRDYIITSIGTIDNRSRTVEKQIRISWVNKSNIEIPDTAVFVKETIKLSGSSTIDGDIGTNSSASTSISLSGSADISGKVFVGPNYDLGNISKDLKNNEIERLPYIKIFNLPEFPEFPNYSHPEDVKDVITNGTLSLNNDYTLTLTNNLHFNKIEVNKGTLYVDVGNSNRNIVVDSLIVKNGTINIIGTGKLTLYVDRDISMSSGGVINTTDEIENLDNRNSEQDKLQLINKQVKKLDVFYKGSSLDLSGQQKIYGSLYARNADIKMSGGSGFMGHIISGGDSISISGGANAVTQVFYVPNADVQKSGSGDIKGNIVAKTLTMSGSGSITYGNVSDEDLPPMFGGSTGTVTSKDILSADPTREK